MYLIRERQTMPPSLLHNVVDVPIDGDVVKGVYHCRVPTAAFSRNLLRHPFDVRLCATRQKDFCDFGRELLGDGCTD
jgi:hypothetical protein